MRVCFISPYPPQHHAVARYTKDLIRTLQETEPGLRISVISHAHTGPEIIDNVNIVRILERKSPFYFAAVLPWILRIKPDVVHVQHDYYAFGGTTNISLALLIVLLKLCSIPTVVTMHEVYPKPELSERSRCKALARYLIFKTQTLIVCKCSGALIVHTNLSRTILQREFGAKRVTTIPHGTRTFATKIPPEDAKKKLNLDGKRVILCFGSLRAGKGLEYAIESMVAVIERAPDAVLLLAGAVAPGSAGYIERLSDLSRKLGVENSVIFTKRYVEEEELPLYFSAADIVILPYLGQFRSGSGVLHLAASYAKPIVASDVGEAAETLRRCEAGILVPQADNSALANALIKLLPDESTRAQMGQNLHTYLVGRSSWENIAETTLRVYRNLISGKNGA